MPAAKVGKKVAKTKDVKPVEPKAPVAPGSNWAMLQKVCEQLTGIDAQTFPKAEPKKVSKKGKEKAESVEQSGRQARKEARREFMSTGIAALARQNDFGRSGDAG